MVIWCLRYSRKLSCQDVSLILSVLLESCDVGVNVEVSSTAQLGRHELYYKISKWKTYLQKKKLIVLSNYSHVANCGIYARKKCAPARGKEAKS